MFLEKQHLNQMLNSWLSKVCVDPTGIAYIFYHFPWRTSNHNTLIYIYPTYSSFFSWCMLDFRYWYMTTMIDFILFLLKQVHNLISCPPSLLLLFFSPPNSKTYSLVPIDYCLDSDQTLHISKSSKKKKKKTLKTFYPSLLRP